MTSSSVSPPRRAVAAVDRWIDRIGRAAAWLTLAVVVLMWFRFTLWREYYNLCSTFEACGSDIHDFEACYKYLAMNQVLTVPPDCTCRLAPRSTVVPSAVPPDKTVWPP